MNYLTLSGVRTCANCAHTAMNFMIKSGCMQQKRYQMEQVELNQYYEVDLIGEEVLWMRDEIFDSFTGLFEIRQ